MGPDEERALVCRAAIEVLRDAAFVFADPAEPPAPIEGELISARLCFAGPRSGSVGLLAPRAFGELLAANLLGTEPGDAVSRAGALEALGETLNMLSGLAIERLFGPGAVCRIGLPELDPTAGAAAPGPSCCVVPLVTDEGHRVDATLQWAPG